MRDYKVFCILQGCLNLTSHFMLHSLPRSIKLRSIKMKITEMHEKYKKKEQLLSLTKNSHQMIQNNQNSITMLPKKSSNHI